MSGSPPTFFFLFVFRRHFGPESGARVHAAPVAFRDIQGLAWLGWGYGRRPTGEVIIPEGPRLADGLNARRMGAAFFFICFFLFFVFLGRPAATGLPGRRSRTVPYANCIIAFCIFFNSNQGAVGVAGGEQNRDWSNRD